MNVYPFARLQIRNEFTNILVVDRGDEAVASELTLPLPALMRQHVSSECFSSLDSASPSRLETLRRSAAGLDLRHSTSRPEAAA